MIEIRHLSKRYPGQKEDTLSDINLTLEETGLYFLVGKSGSGKSTFLSLLGGMDFDYQGSLKVDGKELKSMDEKEKEDYRFLHVSFVFQDFKAEEDETVFSNLRKALDLTDLSEGKKEERILSFLSKVGLKDKKGKTFQNLSGGEKKRVSLVRALIKEGDILLADEPMSSLDPESRKAILALLKKESRRRMVFVITHEEREIPQDCTVIRLLDSRMVVEREGRGKGKKETPSYKRKRYSGMPFWKSLLLSLFHKRSLLIVTFSSLVVSFFSVLFSFLLSGNVKQAMTKALTSYMDEGSMVIKRAEEGAKENDYSLLSYHSLQQIERAEKDYVLSLTAFYRDSLNTLFGSSSSIGFHYLNRDLQVPTLSLDSFLQFELVEESSYPLDDAIDLDSLSEEEVIVGLDEESMIALYLMLFNEEPLYGITEETLLTLRRKVWYSGLTLSIDANKGEWNYYLDHSYGVRDVFLSERSVLVSPDSTFHEHFVSEVLQFVEVDPKEDSTVPWSLHKAYGLRLLPGTNADFLASFLKKREFDGWTVEVLKDKPYYVEDDNKTHNRLLFYQDYLPKISISEIEDFIKAQEGMVECVSYSSSVYTYTASGFISGFQKPFFFSPAKEKLNAIMDEASVSDVNLGAFQGANIEVPEGVLKADLISSMEEVGLRFCSLDSSRLVPSLGEEPTSYEEIGISEGMAKKLFGFADSALGEKLHTLTLDRISKEGERYRNIFSEGSLTIASIYPGEEISLFHHSLFPLCYAFSHTTLSMDEIRISEAVLSCDLKKKSVENFLEDVQTLEDYTASFPMHSMAKEVQSLLDNLSLLFLFFSILSLFSSAFLSALSLYLILRKDRKNIGILLSLGYRKNEIFRYYVTMSSFLLALGYLFALILGKISESTIQKTLDVLLVGGESSFFPYLIPLFVALPLLFLLSLFLWHSLKGLSPKDSFLKN